MRFAEIGLFLSPFALAALWLMLSTRSRWVVWVAVGAVLLFAAGTAWFGLTARMSPGQRYVPAQLRDGRVVGGHGT